MRTQSAWALGVCLALVGASETLGQAQVAQYAVRVQPSNDAAKGQWITLKDYEEIGSPAISPDGKWVAFDAHKDGFLNSQSEIWVARRDGSELQKVATGAAPRFLSDGKTIVFMRERHETNVNRLGVFTVGLDGAVENRICLGRWPDPSPDGKQIAYSVTESRTAAGGAKPLSRVFVADANGANPQVLADGDCPSWSPDGKKIACCFYDPAFRGPMLRLVDIATQEQSILGYGWFRANWLPDGEHVAASGISEAGRQQVSLFNLTAWSKPKTIFSEFTRASAPCYSRDGKLVAFIAIRPAVEEQ